MGILDLKISNDAVHFKKGVEVNSKYTPKEKEKLAKASKEFESMLTSLMIKSMTKTTDGLFGKENYGGDVLDVLFESEISKFITEKQGMGIADKIYKNLTGDEINKLKKLSPEKNLILDFNNANKLSVKPEKGNNIKINSKALDRVEKFNDLIDEAAEKYGVNKKLIKSVILTESAGNPNASSSSRAKGLMQLMDSTAADMGVNNVWNPKENIHGGTKYLSKLLGEFEGDLNLALAAYNAGPGNVKKYNGVPPFNETKNYIKRVNNYLNILE